MWCKMRFDILNCLGMACKFNRQTDRQKEPPLAIVWSITMHAINLMQT